MVAGVAAALRPLLAVAPGPREAERSPPTSRRSSAPNGSRSYRHGRPCPTRASRPPRDRRPARRHRRPHARGQGRVRARRAGARRDAGVDPTLGVRPRCSSWQGSTCRPTRSRSASSTSATRSRTSSSTAASSPCGVAWSTCSQAPRAGRSASTTGATRSNRSGSSCRRRSSRPNASRSAEVPATRELVLDDALRDRARGAAAEAPRAIRRSARAYGRRVVRRRRGVARAVLVRTHADTGRARARGRMGRAHPCASHDRPGRGRPPRGEALAEATAWPAAGVLHARRRDRRSSALHLTESSPRGSTSASSAGARRRATPPSSPRARSSPDPASASCCPVAATARSSAPAR